MENNSIIPTIQQTGGDASNYAIDVYGDRDSQKSVGSVVGGNDNTIVADFQKAQSIKGGSRKRKTNKSNKSNKRKTKKSNKKRSQKKGGSLRKKGKKNGSLRKKDKKGKKEKK